MSCERNLAATLCASLYDSCFLLPVKMCCLLNQMMLCVISRIPTMRTGCGEGVLNKEKRCTVS